MPEITRTFTLEELRELDIPYCDDVVHSEVIDTGRRWMDEVECVFKMQDDGHHYLLSYEQGKTEMQECDWWESLPKLVKLPRVELVKKTVIVETWEPVKADAIADTTPAAGRG